MSNFMAPLASGSSTSEIQTVPLGILDMIGGGYVTESSEMAGVKIIEAYTYIIDGKVFRFHHCKYSRDEIAAWIYKASDGQKFTVFND